MRQQRCERRRLAIRGQGRDPGQRREQPAHHVQRAAGEIAIVDTATLAILARLPLPGIPIRIAITPDGATALVTCAGSSELVAYDVAPRTVRARAKVDVPLAPDAAERPFARLAPGSALPVGLLVARDVTKLLHLEQVRRDFVANVSHELRTPLTVVHGYLDMIEPEEHPELAVMVEEMRRQSQRCRSLAAGRTRTSQLHRRHHDQRGNPPNRKRRKHRDDRQRRHHEERYV